MVDKGSIELVLKILDGSGPIGFYIAAVLVGLTLSVIVLARTAGLFNSNRADRQQTDFLARVIQQYDRLADGEAALRQDADRLEAENDDLKDRIREHQVSVELLRRQLARAIELLTAVRDGRLAPEGIDAELAGLVK